jgi:hypothetical protein
VPPAFVPRWGNVLPIGGSMLSIIILMVLLALTAQAIACSYLLVGPSVFKLE